MLVNHLMEIPNAIQIQINLVTVSQWIARVKATSPTSNVRDHLAVDTTVTSQSANWKYGK